MKKRQPENLRHLTMQELFRVEADTQLGELTSGLLAMERGQTSPARLETLMRAAHSLKGAARIVQLTPAVQLTHAMEDIFVAAQAGRMHLGKAETDTLLRAVDMLGEISRQQETNITHWQTQNQTRLNQLLQTLQHTTQKPDPSQPPVGLVNPCEPPPVEIDATAQPQAERDPRRTAQVGRDTRRAEETPAADTPPAADRVLHLTAENLNRLLGLAGESLVESRWIKPFAENLQRLKRLQTQTQQTLDTLRQHTDTARWGETPGEPTVGQDPLRTAPGRARHSVRAAPVGQDPLRAETIWQETLRTTLAELAAQTAEARQQLATRLEELDLHDRRTVQLSHRLYLEVLRTRMRPFADGVRQFPRMVRDLARALGKNIRLEIHGETTQVDRDILDRLETPLTHLLRNAVDHGCELPEERAAQGKPEEAVVRLEARHSAGMLQVQVSDDGAGLDVTRIREKIKQQGLVSEDVAARMSTSELLEFLFLPGFTLKKEVTEISGRGVGLDVVQAMVKTLRGSVRVTANPGSGMRFQLQLPLTLSVLRALLVEIGGEPYAFPLAQLVNTLKLPRERVETLEGRHHFRMGEQHIGLLAAHQVFECTDVKPPEADLPIVVLGDRSVRYGLLVDRFLGERELVVQPLDARLGKVKDISAAALMEDGAPVLIVDVEDMVRSIEKLVTSGELTGMSPAALGTGGQKRKRVLVVDDSLTVRELERKLLTTRGYHADVAIDGMDGWNAVRAGEFDLVITDVDMPRMDGIELASLIKKDTHLKDLPVMIVSYKEREEDRMRGLEAGADYYLTKGAFHDEALIEAVIDLIGEPDA